MDDVIKIVRDLKGTSNLLYTYAPMVTNKVVDLRIYKEIIFDSLTLKKLFVVNSSMQVLRSNNLDEFSFDELSVMDFQNLDFANSKGCYEAVEQVDYILHDMYNNLITLNTNLVNERVLVVFGWGE